MVSLNNTATTVGAVTSSAIPFYVTSGSIDASKMLQGTFSVRLLPGNFKKDNYINTRFQSLYSQIPDQFSLNTLDGK